MQLPPDSWSAPAANRWQTPQRAQVPRGTAAVSGPRIAIPSCYRRACARTGSAPPQARRLPRSQPLLDLTLRKSLLQGASLNPRAWLLPKHASPLPLTHHDTAGHLHGVEIYSRERPLSGECIDFGSRASDDHIPAATTAKPATPSAPPSATSGPATAW